MDEAVEVLVKWARVKDLHNSLQKGDMRKALSLLEHFSDEELSTDKIGNNWALHCIHPSAFVDKEIVDFTKKVILEYVRRGWDANGVSNGTVIYLNGAITNFTLLHLACMANALEIVKVLVEEVGVDVNCKTEGELGLTPFLILLTQKKWDAAAYLMDMGADLNLGRGRLPSSLVLRKNTVTGEMNPEPSVECSTVELLVRMGCEQGLPLLDKVLSRPDVFWHGANEFHLAVESSNPTYIMKVLQHCAKIISKEDLDWIVVKENQFPALTMPTLVWIFEQLPEYSIPLETIEVFPDLVKIFGKMEYNFNNFSTMPLISHLIRFDTVNETSNLLLRTILQFDHLQLNISGYFIENPMEQVLGLWNMTCNQWTRSPCRIGGNSLKSIQDAVKLLVTHGLNPSGVAVLDCPFHHGFSSVFKMLCRAGAKIPDYYFSNVRVCSSYPDGEKAAEKEIGKLKEWIDHYQKDRLTLKRICGFRVRKMMRCVGDLKMVDGLPQTLKDEVLGTDPI